MSNRISLEHASSAEAEARSLGTMPLGKSAQSAMGVDVHSRRLAQHVRVLGSLGSQSQRIFISLKA